MKKIIKTASVSVITTVVVLIALGEMGIVNVNLPLLEKQKQKQKEVLGIDKVSQLLEIEYPSIGDDMDYAYTLFEDVAFESDVQVDFYILDKQEKIYVEYDSYTNLIESMRIYMSGDVTEIRSLGEKMLPYGYSYIEEDYFTTEKENEIGRYTKTTYTKEYYYELVETEQYALISISYDTSDMFGEIDSPKPISYSLNVSLASEEQILTSAESFQEDETVFTNIDKETTVNNIQEDETASTNIDEETTVNNLQEDETASTNIYEEAENTMESAVSFDELEEVVVNSGDLSKIGIYLHNYPYKSDLSVLLRDVTYFSTERNQYGYNEIAILLLDEGADPNYIDFQGHTSLSIAVYQLNPSLARILLEAGADKHHINANGESILEMVYSMDVPELTEVFEEEY